MGSSVRTTAAPIVGYFLDHKHYAPNGTGPGPNHATPPAQHSSTRLTGGAGAEADGMQGYPRGSDYPDWIKYIYNMQAVEAAGGVSSACLAAFPDTRHYCMIAPHVQPFVQTPFFMFNSKYDAWQLSNEEQLPCFASDAAPKNRTCSAAEQAATVQYGEDFLAAFAPVRSEPRNGAFITSCVCHGCPWYNLSLNNRTSYEHYAAWHRGEAKGAAAITVDLRPPNGGGALTFEQCLAFP